MSIRPEASGSVKSVVKNESGIHNNAIQDNEQVEVSKWDYLLAHSVFASPFQSPGSPIQAEGGTARM